VHEGHGDVGSTQATSDTSAPDGHAGSPVGRSKEEKEETALQQEAAKDTIDEPQVKQGDEVAEVDASSAKGALEAETRVHQEENPKADEPKSQGSDDVAINEEPKYDSVGSSEVIAANVGDAGSQVAVEQEPRGVEAEASTISAPINQEAETTSASEATPSQGAHWLEAQKSPSDGWAVDRKEVESEHTPTITVQDPTNCADTEDPSPMPEVAIENNEETPAALSTEEAGEQTAPAPQQTITASTDLAPVDSLSEVATIPDPSAPQENGVFADDQTTTPTATVAPAAKEAIEQEAVTVSADLSHDLQATNATTDGPEDTAATSQEAVVTAEQTVTALVSDPTPTVAAPPEQHQEASSAADHAAVAEDIKDESGLIRVSCLFDCPTHVLRTC
jgi:hypothetical protein